MTVRSRLRRRTLLRCRFRRLRRLQERRRLRSAPARPRSALLVRFPRRSSPNRWFPGHLRPVRLPAGHLRPVLHRSWGCASRACADDRRSSSAYGLCPCGDPCLRSRCRSALRAGCGWSSAGRPRCALARRLGEREPARAEARRRSAQRRMFGHELSGPRSPARVSFGREWSAACGGAVGGRRLSASVAVPPRESTRREPGRRAERWHGERSVGTESGTLARRAERWHEGRSVGHEGRSVGHEGRASARVFGRTVARPEFRGTGG